MKLMAAEGLERLTVSRLADELDYTAGALYRYFPSKDALLAEMQRRAINTLQAELAAAVLAVDQAIDPEPPGTGAGGGFAELVSLCALAERFLSLVQARPQDVQLINSLLADPRNLITDEQVVISAVLVAQVLGSIEALFDRAAATNALAPGSSSDRTVMLWTSLQSATQLAKLRRFDPHRFDPRTVGGNLYRSLLLGWGADAGTLDRAAAFCTSPSETDDAGHSR